MRLIDADAYQFPGDLENEPTIDAVPVVRCKDCKFNGDDVDCPLQSMFIRTADDDFCSYGERKDNG